MSKIKRQHGLIGVNCAKCGYKVCPDQATHIYIKSTEVDEQEYKYRCKRCNAAFYISEPIEEYAQEFNTSVFADYKPNDPIEEELKQYEKQ